MLRPYFEDSHTTLYQGDAREVLRELPERSVQCVVSSPPYWGLRSYAGVGEQVWGGDKTLMPDGLSICPAKSAHEWGEPLPGGVGGQIDYSSSTLRRDGRTEEQRLRTLANSQPRGETPDDAGAFCRLCGAWRGTLGLEPTPELYVEHMVAVFREVRRVLRDDGTVWLNLGDSYAGGGNNSGNTQEISEKQGSNRGNRYEPKPVPLGLKPKDLVGIPWRVAFALQADGWWLRSAITWCKGSPMPESVTDRPSSATEMVFLLAKSRTYFYDLEATRELAYRLNRGGGGEERGFEVGDASPSGFASKGGHVPFQDQRTPYLVLAALLSAKRILVEQRDDLFCKLFDALKIPAAARSRWSALRVLIDSAPQVVADVFEYVGIVLANGYTDGKAELWPASVTVPGHNGSLAVEESSEPVAKVIRNAERIRQAIPFDALSEGFVNVYFVDQAIAFFERSDADASFEGDGLITEAALQELTLTNPESAVTDDGAYVAQRTSIIPSRNLWNWWVINPQPFPQSHFATFPEALVRPCILAGSREGDIVLDPFSGSGTTALVARKAGRRAVLIELSEAYCEMARDRIAQGVLI